MNPNTPNQEAKRKDIKDYLHLYLPVSVELNNGGSKVYNRTAVAVGNMDDEYRYVTLRVGAGAKAFTHSILFSEKERIKPILRPLSDMTEEEIIRLFNLKGKKCYSPTRVKIEGTIIQYEIYKMAEYDSDYQDIKTMYPEQVAYLLKQGFDLFNLIPEGLAIDKTKLKP